jgi:hypothetical protein
MKSMSSAGFLSTSACFTSRIVDACGKRRWKDSPLTMRNRSSHSPADASCTRGGGHQCEWERRAAVRKEPPARPQARASARAETAVRAPRAVPAVPAARGTPGGASRGQQLQTYLWRGHGEVGTWAGAEASPRATAGWWRRLHTARERPSPSPGTLGQAAAPVLLLFSPAGFLRNLFFPELCMVGLRRHIVILYTFTRLPTGRDRSCR